MPTQFLLVRARRGAPGRSEASSRPGALIVPDAPGSGFLTRIRMGSLRSSGDPSRASAPFQDPGRSDVPSPYRSRRCCPRWMDGEGFGQGLISGLTRSFDTRCHTLHVNVAAHVQGSLPADWLVFAGWEFNPLDRVERFQLVLTIILLSCSPDATILQMLASPLFPPRVSANTAATPPGPSRENSRLRASAARTVWRVRRPTRAPVRRPFRPGSRPASPRQCFS